MQRSQKSREAVKIQRLLKEEKSETANQKRQHYDVGKLKRGFPKGNKLMKRLLHN